MLSGAVMVFFRTVMLPGGCYGVFQTGEGDLGMVLV